MTNEIKELLFLLYNDMLKMNGKRELEDYITNLQEEIKEYEYMIDIRDEREYHKRYLEERRKEQPTLLYPDFDEIYKRYYEQKEKIDKAIEYISNCGCDDEAIDNIKDILRGDE